MALTPEDVVNKRFQQTKFREGYDQDEVDDFLDEIVVELRRLNTENAELREKLAEANTGIPSPAPSAPAAQESTPADADAASSANDLLTLARRLHEEHVQEGATKRDALIAEGHETATRIVAEAEAAAKKQLDELEKEQTRLQARITELTNFEKEYRAKLRSYINDQLAELDQITVQPPQ